MTKRDGFSGARGRWARESICQYIQSYSPAAIPEARELMG